MLYALNEESEKILPLKFMKAKCPHCGSEVIAKCGEINEHHWAHVVNSDCPYLGGKESKWHLDWKALFPKANVEVRVRYCIADVRLNNGWSIEFQNSPISTEDISFRQSCHQNIIWVVNLQNEYSDDRFVIYKNRSGRNYTNANYYFKYKWPKRSMEYMSNVFVDIGDDKLFHITKFGYNVKSGFGDFINKSVFVKDMISKTSP